MALESIFYENRQMIRNKIRKKYGNKGLKQIWHQYQEKHRGEPKIRRIVKTTGSHGPGRRRKRTKYPGKIGQK